MLSKNNQNLQRQKLQDQKQRFTIKRMSVGVASVLLGATFMMAGANQASADTTPTTNTTNATTQQTPTTNAQKGTLAGDVIAKDPTTAPTVANSANGTPEPHGKTVAHGDTTVVPGVNAAADLQVTDGVGGSNNPRFDLTISVDPQAAHVKEGDELSIKLNELGAWAGDFPETLEVNGTTIAKLKDTTTDNMVVEKGRENEKGVAPIQAPYWAQRQGSIEQQLSWNIPNKAVTTTLNYIFTAEVEKMKEFEYTFHKKATNTGSPQVTVDTIHHSSIEVGFNGTEKTVVAKDYLTNKQALGKPSVNTEKSVQVISNGGANLDDDGYLTEDGPSNSLLNVYPKSDLPTGTIISFKVNDPKFAQFKLKDKHKLGDTFSAQVQAAGMQANAENVILKDYSAPTFELVSVSNDEVTFKVVDGTLRDGYAYIIHDNSDATPFKRVLGEKGKEIAEEKTRQMRKSGQREVGFSSDLGGTTTFTLPNEAKKITQTDAQVSWTFKIPDDAIAQDGGNYKSLDGQVIIRYIGKDNKRELLNAQPVINLSSQENGSLNKDTFSVLEPKESDVIVDNESNKIEFNTTELTHETTATDNNKYYNYELKSVPYYVKDSHGEVYRFAGFETDNAVDTADYEQTSGPVVSPDHKQTAIVATYQMLDFGDVVIQPVDKDKNNLGDEIKTKYAFDNHILENEVGNDYKVTPDTLDKEIKVGDKTYVLVPNQTPSNATGKLTDDKIVVNYTYRLKPTVTTDTTTSSRTIEFMTEDGTKLQDPVTQTAHFTREVTVDNEATDKDQATTTTPWKTTDKYDAQNVPATIDVNGTKYAAVYMTVDGKKEMVSDVAANDTPQAKKNETIVVTYRKVETNVPGDAPTVNLHQAAIHTRVVEFVDKEGNKLQDPVTNVTAWTFDDDEGKYVTKDTYPTVTVPNEINGLIATYIEKDGVKDTKIADIAADDTPELKDEVIKVVYEAKTSVPSDYPTVNVPEMHIRVVEFVDKNGNKLQDSVTNETNWTFDDDEGKYVTDDTYPTVKVPTNLDGLIAAYILKDGVMNTKVTDIAADQKPEAKDQVIKVVYTIDGTPDPDLGMHGNDIPGNGDKKQTPNSPKTNGTKVVNDGFTRTHFEKRYATASRDQQAVVITSKDNGKLPQTGDENGSVSLVGAMLVAAGSMFGLASLKRKDK